MSDKDEIIKDLLANLVAATSAYEKYAGNSERRSVRDPFFKTRLSDFEKCIKRNREKIEKSPE